MVSIEKLEARSTRRIEKARAKLEAKASKLSAKAERKATAAMERENARRTMASMVDPREPYVRQEREAERVFRRHHHEARYRDLKDKRDFTAQKWNARFRRGILVASAAFLTYSATMWSLGSTYDSALAHGQTPPNLLQMFGAQSMPEFEGQAVTPREKLEGALADERARANRILRESEALRRDLADSKQLLTEAILAGKAPRYFVKPKQVAQKED